MSDNQKWDYKKFPARFCHKDIDGVRWFLFKDGERFFFSEVDPPSGIPIALPKGYKVVVDKNAKKPRLEKEKSVSDAIDDFFADDTNEEETHQEKKNRYPSERHDKYKRWKY